ncbi:MAG TPA: hopanoid biosynthesis-associated protein HpnK [Opitutaceae bacterium]|jgi:hopanoid biosynthesis associated protein HpnK|nr:hopanoid biosynthesis-associated protein HpnK [Opitutaceae bacterium]
MKPAIHAARRPGLIVTADDFGLHPAINEAVEIAHTRGILTAASLMVAGPAVEDAVGRARRLPRLRVGLHLVLADGPAALKPDQIPGLVGPSGRFGNRMAWDGARFFFLPSVRRQLESEIRAQFQAYAATGLALDHVNAHKHFHLHPTVLGLILRVGREFGRPAVRIPAEPGGPSFLRPWLALMRWRLKAAGVGHNDRVFGLRHSGRMTETALLDSLSRVRDGLTEVYLHPATISGAAIAPTMAGYRHADELAALLSPAVRLAADRLNLPRGGYSDFASIRPSQPGTVMPGAPAETGKIQRPPEGVAS